MVTSLVSMQYKSWDFYVIFLIGIPVLLLNLILFYGNESPKFALEKNKDSIGVLNNIA